MHQIVVLDGYTLNPGDLSWKSLEDIGEVRIYDRTEAKDIPERIGDSDIVLTNKTVLTEETLKACPTVRYIGCMATGYNVIDVAAANKLGMTVTNIPAYGTEAVAQFTMALLLEITSRVGMHSEAVKQGQWSACPGFCSGMRRSWRLAWKNDGYYRLWGDRTVGGAEGGSFWNGSSGLSADAGQIDGNGTLPYGFHG